MATIKIMSSRRLRINFDVNIVEFIVLSLTYRMSIIVLAEGGVEDCPLYEVA